MCGARKVSREFVDHKGKPSSVLDKGGMGPDAEGGSVYSSGVENVSRAWHGVS